MKKIKVSYWVFTALFAAFMIMSAIPDILSQPIAVEGMHKGLGYPLYFIPFIGVAKLLGAIAILIPGFPRIKEWAYAGLVFDLVGATYSILAIGKAADAIFMVLPLALAATSYILYHKKIKATVERSATTASIHTVGNLVNQAV
jgi:uncharacterized membrane protein YphA (DoxX/SURF4 family)